MEPKGRSRGRGRSTGSGQVPGGGHGPRPGPPHQGSGNGQSSRGSRSQPPQQMYQPPMPVPAPAREFQTQQLALYTPQRLHPDPMEKFVETENGDKIRITLRMVGDVVWGDYHYIQLFNIIIRKCLNFMKFQLVGRDYYDPHSKININDHKLELWPGFTTSMRQHEQNILLNCDVAFKIMRNDNVYDLLMECRSGNPRAEFQSKIIGSTVLTYYNNRTYRIDDIDYSSKPTSTFPMKDGKEISFVEYYKRKYNINIQVENQPLLVSRSKPREIRAGMPETVLLIPELCQLTGLTDQQRENFHLMRALADHTRIGPPQR